MNYNDLYYIHVVVSFLLILIISMYLVPKEFVYGISWIEKKKHVKNS